MATGFLPVWLDYDKYRVNAIDGRVELWVPDEQYGGYWCIVEGQTADEVRNKSGWIPEMDGWRPTWAVFGKAW